MRSRFPDYEFVIKFRCQIDEDGKTIERSQQMAFWFENIPSSPHASYDVAEQADSEKNVECVEDTEEFEDIEDQYAPNFIRFLNPREYWLNQEKGLPWYPVDAFIEPGVDIENPLRDRKTEWYQTDELSESSGFHGISPLLEFLDTVPNQEASLLNAKK